MPRTLLIGPYSRKSVKWANFGAPPLGIHRVASFLKSHGEEAKVIDPDLEENPREVLRRELSTTHYDYIGTSVLHTTIENDASLAHYAKQISPDSIFIGGGQEVTFDPQTIFGISPIDVIVRGEGEKPMLALASKTGNGPLVDRFRDVDGLFIRSNGSYVATGFNPPLNGGELGEILQNLDWGGIGYDRYWDKTRAFYAEDLENPLLRERRLQEIYTMRIVEANYCPLKCTFCSSTNFQDEAAGKNGTKVVALSVDGLLDFIEGGYQAYPQVRTFLIQDDNFLLGRKAEGRVRAFDEQSAEMREHGRLPDGLSFICQSLPSGISLTTFYHLREAAFRMIGYGVESFSPHVLSEFNKPTNLQNIHKTLTTTLAFEMLPFINVILTSPESGLEDVFTTVDGCIHYIGLGAECGAYPYVIPLPGTRIAEQARAEGLIEYQDTTVPDTDITFRKAVRILPRDPATRDLLLLYETGIEEHKAELLDRFGITHAPSRVNSLVTFHAMYKIAKQQGFGEFADRAQHQMESCESLLSRYKSGVT